MKIGFDFDGTLAVWPRGVRANYRDPYRSVSQCAAVLGTMKWLKMNIRNGHDVVIITGRDSRHLGAIRYWLFQFTGQFLEVVTRPGEVDLDELSQATWKAKILENLGVDVYVGDNYAIDRVAAEAAGIRFLDAAGFRKGDLPAIAIAVTIPSSILDSFAERDAPHRRRRKSLDAQRGTCGPW